MRGLHRRALRLALAIAVALGIAGGGCAYLDTKQRELIFRAMKEPRPGVTAEGYGARELWLPVAAGEQLHAWWWPAAEADAPTMLYLHGARLNISASAWRVTRLQRMGFNVLAIDYRGFGLSSGDLPSEGKAYEDARIAWDWVRAREPDVSRRFVYGHSLGGAIAIDLATRVDDIGGLIVESSFTSIRDMAALTWARWLPVGWILTQHFDSLAKVERLRVPVLYVHGTADRWVPAAMTERLYAATRSPKRLLLVEGASHSNVTSVAFDTYRDKLRELQSLAASTMQSRLSGD